MNAVGGGGGDSIDIPATGRFRPADFHLSSRRLLASCALIFPFSLTIFILCFFGAIIFLFVLTAVVIFGSVFLARKRGSGRRVALKVMPMDTSDDEEYERFIRELESVVGLNDSADEARQRDLNIVFFEDWFISASFACIGELLLRCYIVLGPTCN